VIDKTRRIVIEGPAPVVDQAVAVAKRRQLEDNVRQVEQKLDRLEARGRRAEAEPIVDSAIARGALPAAAKEPTLRLFETASQFDAVRTLVESRPSDPALARANEIDSPELERQYEQVCDRLGIPKEARL